MGESNRVVVARADIALAPFATGGVAGTFVDVGYTMEEASYEPVFTLLDIEPEQTLCAVDAVIVKLGQTLKFNLMEAKLENFQRYLHQVAADLTGTDPNKSLKLNEPWRDGLPQLWQIRLTTKGTKLSTDPAKLRASRALTFWKCIVSGLDPLRFKKEAVTPLPITAKILHDESSSVANGIYGTLADTGGT